MRFRVGYMKVSEERTVGPVLEIPITRTIVYWYVYRRPPIYENYHVGLS